MRSSRSKILNTFLLAVMLITFGGGELLHHHGSSFEDGSRARISSHDECHHHGHAAIEKECSTCLLAHTFKNTAVTPDFFGRTLVPVHYRTYTYKFTALINPFIHNNTGLSPPTVS